MLNKKSKVALSSVAGGAFLTIIKLVTGIITGSLGILSEAMHSALDLVTAILTFFAVRVGDKPPDKSHPYGHAKVESVAALVETGLLFLTSVWIVYEAVGRLLGSPVQIDVTWYALATILISIIVDVSRSRALMRVARETKSQALEADALHFSSDIWSSGAVIAGLVGVSLGWEFADAIAALVVAVVVIHAGYSLGKRTIAVLVDAAPEGLSDFVIEITRGVEGVVRVEQVRARPAGASMFIDMSIQVSRLLPLERVRQIIEQIRVEVQKKVPKAEITIHAIPVALDDETIVEQVRTLAATHGVTAHDIVVQTSGAKKSIYFHLEVDPGLCVSEAHEQASHIETTLASEFGNEIEICTHIEPLETDIEEGEKIPEKEEQEVLRVIKSAVKRNPSFKTIQSVDIKRVQKELRIALFLTIDPTMLLRDAHEHATKLEHSILESLQGVERVIIHTEPDTGPKRNPLKN